jgi:lipoate-protein ligase A
VGDWAVRYETGTVAELHERSVDALAGASERTVLVMAPADSALVLGSSQPGDVADALACRQAGVSIVRRRSGGGAVLIEPGAQLWVDLLLPAGDALSEADVGRAAWWAGEAWASALSPGALGPTARAPSALAPSTRATGAVAPSTLAPTRPYYFGVWKGPLVRRPWSELVCFATLGAGEVTMAAGGGATPTDADPAGGAKVVGISQRRTRAGAMFQCSCLLRWEPEELVGLLALWPSQRREATRNLRRLAAPVPARLAGGLVERLLAALP